MSTITSNAGRRWTLEPRMGIWRAEGAILIALHPEHKMVTTWWVRRKGLPDVDTNMISANDAIEWADANVLAPDEDRAAEHKDLSALCLEHLRPPKYNGGSWTLNPDALAEAIMAAGWKR